MINHKSGNQEYLIDYKVKTFTSFYIYKMAGDGKSYR